MFESGSSKVRIVGGSASFYEEYETTNAYVERPFGGACNTITVTNDSASDTISLSFDGANVESDLKAGESITLNTQEQSSIYVVGASGGDNVRIWSW